ncbi:DUF2846 domain-containing protein [Endozoicomonas sp. G2_1]|uniref:DUF2846 domain-containing protein n=1 Tax=Endozoicomonas sp. G2_1 TaxID=2821091 RepID=UPI001AD97ED3|nr:DUF2846 domain-containing protein [Endozoicomonas sp. G2_1]
MKAKFIVVISLLVLITGCIATGKKFSTVLPSANGQGLVYIYHPKDAQFGASEADFLYLNGEEVFRFTHGGYSYFYLEPGIHNFQIRLSTFFVATEQVKQQLNFEVEAGKTYFIRYYEHKDRTEFYSTGTMAGAYQLTKAELKEVAKNNALVELPSKRLLKHKLMTK